MPCHSSDADLQLDCAGPAIDVDQADLHFVAPAGLREILFHA
jgi:hypothetical protein